MKKLILSILIPSYNYKKGLVRILHNLSNVEIETLENIEILIGDDSEEKLLNNEEIDFYKNLFPNFRYLININGKGISNNFNNLIDNSSAEYSWLLNHDEFIESPKIMIPALIRKMRHNLKELYIVPISKRLKINFFKFNINLEIKITSFKKLIILFLKKYWLFSFINLIGSPSSIIFKTNIKLRYSNCSWYTDIDYYIRLFKQYKYPKINIIEKNTIHLISDQSYQGSASLNLKKDKNWKLLRKKEYLFLCKKYDIKELSKITKTLIYLFHKSYLFLTIKFIKVI